MELSFTDHFLDDAQNFSYTKVMSPKLFLLMHAQKSIYYSKVDIVSSLSYVT